MSCHKVPESGTNEGVGGLPIAALSCQDVAEMVGGEGLPEASASWLEITKWRETWGCRELT